MSDMQQEAMEENASVEDEFERKAFVMIAESQVTIIIEQIRALSVLADPERFIYTEGDAAKIVSALSDELLKLRDNFAAKNPVGFRI